MKKGLFCLVALLFLAACTSKGPGFDDGVAAMKAGEHEKAYGIFKALADQGNARAENELGLMNENGEGIPLNYPEAMTWYRKAAEGGYPLAQCNLGVMCYKGEGTPRDVVQAYTWFDLAALQGEPHAQRYVDTVAGEMTHNQIVEAQQRAREWQQAHRDVSPAGPANGSR